MPVTITPALSPPHVPTTSVMGVEVAAEHARMTKLERTAVILVMP